MLVITQCCIAELYSTKEQAPIALAKTCERRRCGHIPDPIPSHKCLTSCLDISGENKHRYILATQDAELRAEMRQIPGVPLIYIKRAVMVMEPISPATLAKRDALERSKLGGMERLGKRKQRDEEDEEDKPKKKKKGPKEPNPLSVKKRKQPAPTLSAKLKGGVDASTNNEVDDDERVTPNIIDDPTDSVPRHKSTRRRKHHKKPVQQQEMIPTEPEVTE
jgi:U3 small nucleolar RNA-associated protein 23